VVERDEEAAGAARNRVADAVARSAARGALDEPADAVMARFRTSTDSSSFGGCGLVVEAVPENFDLKVAALKAVEAHLAADAFLATNTSSLSVTQLAAQLRRPGNFVGLHFFNPVPASALIEVVLARQTSPGLAAEARAWAQALGKTAVVVNDAPGFASSRLGVAIALEAMRMLEEGVASADDIDAAMVLGYRHPTGPLRTTDLVGLDVRLGIAEYLHATLGERFAPPEILKSKVARGELGRKTGKGFFDWSD
jgi:3-hydroxybutyryl-CoA dehydrogenase